MLTVGKVTPEATFKIFCIAVKVDANRKGCVARRIFDEEDIVGVEPPSDRIADLS